MLKKFELNLENLHQIVNQLPNDGIIILRGDLASGKTTLVKALCRNLGFLGEVTSPTFSVMNNYDNMIFHYDIYQVGFSNFIQSGLFENLFEDGLHLIEWGDENLENLLKKYELSYCLVEILPFDKNRIYKVKYV